VELVVREHALAELGRLVISEYNKTHTSGRYLGENVYYRPHGFGVEYSRIVTFKQNDEGIMEKTKVIRNVFIGSYKSGIFCGYGTLRLWHNEMKELLEIIGQWNDGDVNGHAKMRHINSVDKKHEQYVGTWKANMKHGLGKYININSSDWHSYDQCCSYRFFGYWQNGKKHGLGREDRINGSWTLGSWKNDKVRIRNFYSLEQFDLWKLNIDTAILLQNEWFSFVTLLTQAAYILYETSTLNGEYSKWNRYQQFLLKVMNSGVLATLSGWWLSLYANSMQVSKEKSHNNNWLPYCVGVPICFVLVLVLLTHVIPMVFMYIWVAVIWEMCFVLVFYTLYSLSLKCCGGKFIAGVILSFIKKITVVGVITFTCQTLLHFGVLVYAQSVPISGHEYIHVIVDEYNIRRTDCYFDGMKASFEKMYSFMTWWF